MLLHRTRVLCLSCHLEKAKQISKAGGKNEHKSLLDCDVISCIIAVTALASNRSPGKVAAHIVELLCTTHPNDGLHYAGEQRKKGEEAQSPE